MITDEGLNPPAEAPQPGYLDRERFDLLSRGDMLQILRFTSEPDIPAKNKPRADKFFVSAGKAPGTSFLRDEDDSVIMDTFHYSALLYGMDKPRSEKNVNDYIEANELRTLVLSSVRRSQGFAQNKTNALTLFSTIFRHNIHTMSDMNPQRPGFMGKIGGLLKNF